MQGELREQLNEDNCALTNPQITILYDNYSYQENVATGWGFACCIQGMEKTILFDTGGDGLLLRANMRQLNIHPAQIELVVLSHFHWDHIGGLHSLVAENSDLSIFFPHSFSVRFQRDLERYGVNTVAVQSPVPVCDNVYVTGQLGQSIIEQGLVLRTAKGPVLITGCAHPGIVDIIKVAKNIVNDQMLLVMGGFHLMNCNREQLKEIRAEFRSLGVRYVAPSHCSGDLARQLLAGEYGDHNLRTGVGSVISVSEL